MLSHLSFVFKLNDHGIYDAIEKLGDIIQIRQLFTGFQRHLFEGQQSA